MSKRCFVLFSHTEAFIPEIYLSKATITKYLAKNPALTYQQFVSKSQASNFVKNLSMNENVKIAKSELAKEKASSSKKSKKSATKSQSSSNLQQQKPKAKKTLLNVKRNEQFQSNLLAHEKQYGKSGNELIQRLRVYLTTIRAQNQRIFYLSSRQIQTAPPEKTQQFPKKSRTDSQNMEPKSTQAKIIKEKLVEANMIPEINQLKLSKPATKREKIIKRSQTQDQISLQQSQISQETEKPIFVEESPGEKISQDIRRRLKEQIPFYKPCPIINLQSNQLKGLIVKSAVFRRQNPGYTTASYEIRDWQSKQIITKRENYSLGITKAEQGQLFGLLCALNDLSLQNSLVKLVIQTDLWCQKTKFERFKGSLDHSIRSAAQLLSAVEANSKKVEYL